MTLIHETCNVYRRPQVVKIMKNALRSTLYDSRLLGFTLIELLVVIGIMGTLVTVMLPNFIGGRQRSKDARRRLDVEQIRSSLEQYRSVVGSYPASLILNCDPARETLIYTDPVTSATTTFLTAIPQDPGCNTYVYYSTMSSSPADYTVCAYLEASTSSTSILPLPSCGGQPCNYCLGPYGAK